MCFLKFKVFTKLVETLHWKDLLLPNPTCQIIQTTLAELPQSNWLKSNNNPTSYKQLEGVINKLLWRPTLFASACAVLAYTRFSIPVRPYINAYVIQNKLVLSYLPSPLSTLLFSLWWRLRISKLKGLSHEIVTCFFWVDWIYLGLNRNCLWFFSFKEISFILVSQVKY